ncbi:hypothetical protein D3P09_02630 [Paenibacillus pinisoli]|uniref:Uncharacterized protein n=2 Tax=Paenibacillus pinisoli TaxID=1276110 RepID=A0A3A6PVT9_9BACL|nr:hypothetical protein D3P09_02630 [Paenibacillus pinisoli]
MKESNESRDKKENIKMGKAIATVILVAAVIVLISMTIFSKDGTFGDAKVQRDRAHNISQTTTIPTTLP